jgi:acyl carrier protein
MSTQDRIKKILLENVLKDLEPNELKTDSPLIEYGVGLDSVATLELVVALEQEFKIQIDESEIMPETFETINTISKHIKSVL